MEKTYSSGRIAITCIATLWDHDLHIEFSGGQKHLGGLKIIDRSGQNEKQTLYAPENHKEMVIINEMIPLLEQIHWKKLLVFGGIHYDHINKEELSFIHDRLMGFCRELSGAVHTHQFPD